MFPLKTSNKLAMRGNKYIILLLLLLGFSLPQLSASQIDSLTQAFQAYKNSTSRHQAGKMLDFHMKLGKAYQEAGEIESAIQFYESALKWSEDDLSFFKIHYELGYLLRLQSNYAKAMEHSQVAQERASYDIPPKLRGANLHQMAQLYVNLGDLDQALRLELENLQLQEEGGDSLGIAKAYAGMGRIYFYSGDKEQALENDLKAMRIKIQYGTGQDTYRAYVDVASSFSELMKLDSARYYAKKAQAVAREIEFGHGIAFTNALLGEVARKQGNPQEAMDYIQEARIAFRQMKSPFPLSDVLNIMGETLISLGNIPDGIDTLHTALNLAQRIGYQSLEKDISGQLADHYYKQGKYKTAMEFSRTHQQLKDSINSKEVQSQMAQLAQKYKLNRAKIEMELLKQEQEVQTRNMFLVILGMGIFLLGIILLLLNYRYKLQKKAKEMVELKNKEIRIQHERIEEANKDWQFLADMIYKDIHQQVKTINERLNHLTLAPNPESNGKGESAVESIHAEMALVDESLSHLESYVQAGIQDEPTEVLSVGVLVKEARQSLPKAYQGLCRKVFTYDLPPIKANRNKIRLMIQHVLLFAIKNRGDAPLEIHITSKPVDCPYTGEPEYLFSFKDNGIAIPKEKREEVFHQENFSQNANSLHLVISKKILHVYNGHMWLDPDVEEGNLVHIVLPLSKIGVDQPEVPVHPAHMAVAEGVLAKK